MNKNFGLTENKAVEILSQKKDVSIRKPFIQVLNGKSKKSQFQKVNDLGNGSWGKIDYLLNVHNYRLLFVSEFIIA